MGGISQINHLARNSNKIKDLIIDILSNDFPLTAKKIHNAIIRKYGISIAYQNVHKFSKELVQQGILKEIDREYLINTEWLDQIKEFSERIKRVYLNKPNLEENNFQNYYTNTYGVIQLYKKKLIEQLEPELENKPFINAIPLALSESNVRITAGKEINISVIPEQKSVLVLGDSGSGKTTVLKMLALQEAKQNNLIPIFFELNEYQGEDVLQIISKQINLFTGQDVEEDTIKSLIREGSFIFLFDGLNEANSEIKINKTKYEGYGLVINNVKEIVSDKEFSKNIVIISCRTYSDPKQRLPFSTFKLQPFTEGMIEVYLSNKNTRNLFIQIRRHRKLLSFCQNPLMLSMLLKIFKDKKINAVKKSELYKCFIDKFLYEWESKTIKAKKEIIVNDMVRILSKLAYEMSSKGLCIDFSETHSIMEHEAKDLGLTKSYLNEIIQYILQTNLLVKENSHYKFMHQSIQEYFAAIKLKDTDIGKEELERKILDKRWHETLIFYASIEDADSLVADIYRLFRNTMNHFLLFLAAKCIIENGNVRDSLAEDILDSLLQIYHYSDEEFYFYWYDLNNVFKSWQDKKVINRIIEFFNSSKGDISPRVVNVLHHSDSALHSQHKGIRKLQEVIATKSKNKHLLYSAIEILALAKDTKIVVDLIKLLSDKDPILKSESCWALKEIGGEALDKVREVKRVKNPIQFLTNLQQSNFQALVNLLDKNNEDFIRGHAIIELSKMDYKKALPYILECLKEKKPIIKYHATYMIPKLDDEDASLLLNHIQTKKGMPEEYSKVVSSIDKTNGGIQNGGRKFGV